MNQVKEEVLSVEEAINIFGGKEKLSEILDVPVTEIDKFLNDDSYQISWFHGDVSSSKFVDHIYLQKDIICAAVPSSLDIRSGYVYCVSNGEKMKIGRTRNPDQRIKEIKSSRIVNASRVFVTPFIQDCVELETLALREFSEIKVLGEVFECNFDRAVEFISGNIKPWRAGLRMRKPSASSVMNRMMAEFGGAK